MAFDVNQKLLEKQPCIPVKTVREMVLNAQQKRPHAMIPAYVNVCKGESVNGPAMNTRLTKDTVLPAAVCSK